MTTRPTDVEERLRALHDAICPDETDGDGCTDPGCPDLVAVRSAYVVALEDAALVCERVGAGTGHGPYFAKRIRQTLAAEVRR